MAQQPSKVRAFNTWSEAFKHVSDNVNVTTEYDLWGNGDPQFERLIKNLPDEIKIWTIKITDGKMRITYPAGRIELPLNKPITNAVITDVIRSQISQDFAHPYSVTTSQNWFGMIEQVPGGVVLDNE